MWKTSNSVIHFVIPVKNYNFDSIILHFRFFLFLNFPLIVCASESPDALRLFDQIQSKLQFSPEQILQLHIYLSGILFTFYSDNTFFHENNHNYFGTPEQLISNYFLKRTTSNQLFLDGKNLPKLELTASDLKLVLQYLDLLDAEKLANSEGSSTELRFPHSKVAIEFHGKHHYDQSSGMINNNTVKKNLIAKFERILMINLDSEYLKTLCSIDLSLNQSLFMISKYFIQEFVITLRYQYSEDTYIKHKRITDPENSFD